jgi:hypothetical protein
MLTTSTKYHRLREIVRKLDGAIALSTLKRFCDERKIEFSTSAGGGVRYLTDEQLAKLFPIINKEVK